jgi:hypothetical protein
MFLLPATPGVGTAFKQSEGLAPKVLRLAGVAVVALAGVVYRTVSLKAELKGNGPTPAQS